MNQIIEMYPMQLELATQIEEALKDIGTVIILQKAAGVEACILGDTLVENYSFRYCGRGVYARAGVLGKMIVMLDKRADGNVYIRNVDVYYETTVIAAEGHFDSRNMQRPNVLGLDAKELDVWQNEFDKRLESLLDEED